MDEYNKYEEKKFDYGVCPECNKNLTEAGWCSKCDPGKFLTSGNPEMDKLIYESRLKTRSYDKDLEWIPYDRFKDLEWIPYDRFQDIKLIGEGGFADVFSATWLDGTPVFDKNHKKRTGPITVALKKLKNSNKINNMEAFINEIKKYNELAWELEILTGLYGITKDPQTEEFMMVLKYAECGNLRNYLKTNFSNLKWIEKLLFLDNIAFNLRIIHSGNYIHKDLHSGNILIKVQGPLQFRKDNVRITDLGLAQLIRNSKTSNSSNVCGVLPYIAPEVLDGKPYTFASDVYSFGIIMVEMSTGKPPYGSVPHDEKLALAICNGLRPRVTKGTPQCYIDLVNQCLDANPEKRPSTYELCEIISVWCRNKKDIEFVDTDEITTFSEMVINPKAIYTSRFMSFNNISSPINSTGVQIEDPEVPDSQSINLHISKEFKNSQKRRETYGTCGECNKPGTGEDWCRDCNSKRLKGNFKNWTSGNKDIDKLIQQSQINAVHHKKCLEWIPSEKFQEVEYIARGGFGKFYSAKWPEGFIRYWDIENQKWVRETNVKVALKSLDNSSNINKDFLSPIKSYLQIYSRDIVPCYGITQNPVTKDYMIVLKFCEEGNLRSYLSRLSRFNKNYLNYNFKIRQLSLIARGLLDIHNAGKVHENFHSSNILFNYSNPFISDLGMCRPINSQDQSVEKERVYGVSPYMAPEIIHGSQYTKAADIYSFGIIINEFMSEEIPYNDIRRVQSLAVKICKGLRPTISEETPKLIADLITRCWDAKAKNRPTASELYQILEKWVSECEFDIDSEIYTQVREYERKWLENNSSRNKFDNNQTHPQEIYNCELKDLPNPVNSSDSRHLIESSTGNTRSDDKIVSMNTNIGDIIPWSNALEVFLRELYLRDDIADVFWGRRFEEHNAGSTIWQIYVVTRLFCQYVGSKVIDDQTIHFIEEAAGFSNAERLPQNSYDLLPTWKKVPQDLQISFDEALEDELRPSFRDAHYNLVGMSTGYKRTGGQFTTTPAIILYVRQKGILRRGCDGPFPKNIRGYPTDVVEACLATPCGGEELCQRYQTDIKLGSSIGIGITGSEKTTGTLGAVVRERESNRIGILSCEHVLKFKETNSTEKIIYQPSREDLLDNPQRRLTDLISQSKEQGARMEDFEDDIQYQQRMVDRAKNRIPISELATYESGIRENVFLKSEGKSYGVDAAFGILTNSNRKLYTRKFAIISDYFVKANLSDDTCLKGAYTHEELKSKDFDQVFKVGRTTGLTIGKYISSDSSVAIDLKGDIIKYGEEYKKEIKDVFLDNFIGYLKASIHEEIHKKRQQCYPIKWFDRQMMFYFRPEEFKCGDSGASVVDENGMALGLLHAKWITALYTCGVASPYFAVFEALNVELCLTNDTIP